MVTKKKTVTKKTSPIKRKTKSSKKKITTKKSSPIKRKAKPSKKKTTTKKTSPIKRKTKSSKKKSTAKNTIKSTVVRSSDYKGSKIEVVADKVGHEVQVDGKAVIVSRDADTGAYSCPETPYVYYDSLEEVAQAIVDTKNEE